MHIAAETDGKEALVEASVDDATPMSGTFTL